MTRYNFLRWDYWFGQVDGRPLSLFRIAFALILLKDALYHIPLARIFYSDNGLLPRNTLTQVARNTRFSLMDGLGTEFLAVVFFVLWALVAFCLLIGYRTRLMSILNFVMVVSIHERNLYIIDGGDTIMRALSFWMMFIAVGEYYSLDALRARWYLAGQSKRVADLRAPSTPRMIFALPVRAIQIQVGFVYLFTFWYKTYGHTWLEGDAVYYALQLKSFTHVTGDIFVAVAPDILLKLITYFVMVAEGAFFPLVFSPIFQPYLRIIGLTSIAFVHIGIGVLMSIPNFSLLMLVSYLVFFQPEWILWLEKHSRVRRTTTILPKPKGRTPLWLLVALTTPHQIQLSNNSVNDEPITIAKCQDMLGQLPLSRFWLWVLRWQMARDALWKMGQIALVNYYPPEDDEMPPSVIPQSRFGAFVSRSIVANVVLFFLVNVLAFNLWQSRPLGRPLGPAMNDWQFHLIQTVGLWQVWNMFSENPLRQDGWIVVTGRFEDGRVLDLRTGEPVTGARLRFFFGPDVRWKKYEDNIRNAPADLLSAWGAYFCASYNGDPSIPRGQHLATLEIVWRYRNVLPRGEGEEAFRDDLRWKHWCYPEYRY